MTLYEKIIQRNPSGSSENQKILSAYDSMLMTEVVDRLNVDLLSETWIKAAREVLKKHSMVYINPKTNKTSEDKKKGFIVLDAVTANMLVTIADALSKEANQKFTSMNLVQAVDIGWKLIKK